MSAAPEPLDLAELDARLRPSRSRPEKERARAWADRLRAAERAARE